MEANQNSGTALLVMDIQVGFLEMVPNSEAVVKSVNTAIDAARLAKIPVIYVVVGFRKGYPEVSQNNKMFSMIKKFPISLEDPKVHPSVNPQPDDIIVVKRRVSAFSGSDLQVVLSALKITKLVLTGFATSGVVLSTVREASDKDFVLTVLSDGCADGDAEVHTVLTTKIFTRQADVVTAEEWAKSITTKTA